VNKFVQAAIGFAISGVFLFLAFRSIDFAALRASLSTINAWYILPFVAVTMAQMWWRAVRWRVLLKPEKDCSSLALFGPMMVGFAFNSVFPARAGEVARPMALAKTEDIPFAAGLSTVVLERLLDAITLLVILAIVPAILPFDPAVEQVWDGRREIPGSTLAAIFTALGLGMGAVAGFFAMRVAEKKPGLAKTLFAISVVCGIGGLVAAFGPFIDRAHNYEFGSRYVLNAETFKSLGKGLSRTVAVLLFGVIAMMLPPVQRLTLAVIDRAPLIPEGLRAMLRSLFNKFVDGFRSLRDPKSLVIVVLHSIGIWALGGFSFQLMSWGVPGLEMTLTHALAFLAITAIAISVPSAPGFWGLYEAGGIVALLVLGLVPSTAEGRALGLGYTIICHFFQWLPITIIGLIYAGKIHIGKPVATVAE
jgi:uncharacterized membrane protein YbhN (UPF0104 family)